MRKTRRRIDLFFRRWYLWIPQLGIYILSLIRDAYATQFLFWAKDRYGGSMIEYLSNLVPNNLTEISLSILLVSIAIVVLYDFLTPQKEVVKYLEQNPHSEVFERRDATKLLSNLLDDFSQKFIHIREAYPTPEEKAQLGKNGDIHLIRLQSATDSYTAMRKQFEVVKYFLYDRTPVEEGINRLWTLLQMYSNDIAFWKANPENQALARKVLNKPADKVMNEVKEITENIKDLLRPNITSVGIRKIERKNDDQI